MRAVVMVRRNLVKQAISHMNAARLYERTRHKRGRTAWNLYSEEDRMDALHADSEAFDRTLRRVVFDEAILTAFAEFVDVPSLRVEYADLLRDSEAWFRSVYEFLGVPDPSTESAVLKNTDDDLRSAVANFDELRSRYVGTRFEPMFDEVVA